MKDLGLYVVVLVVGALLGLSGGIAATSSMGRNGGSNSTGGTLSSDIRERSSVDADTIATSPIKRQWDNPYPVESRFGVENLQQSFPNTMAKERSQVDVRPRPSGVPELGQPDWREPAGGAVFTLSSLAEAPDIGFVQWARQQPASVKPTFFADVNFDGVVNVEDLAIIAAAFGSTSPDPPWLDINADGEVNESDLAIVVKRFGETS
jgi:hypothetical protein